MAKAKLKPCPFCGSEVDACQVFPKRWRVGCGTPFKDYDMDHVAVSWAETKSKAVNAWNRRSKEGKA